MSRTRLASLSLCVLATAAPLTASAETILALNANGRSFAPFDSATPGAITADDPTEITGLDNGVSIRAFDFRPSTGTLYGLGSDSFVYAIDVASGAASKLGDTAIAGLTGNIGFDFNSVSEQIRIVTDSGANVRFNLADNTATADDDLEYATLEGLVRDDDDIRIAGIAYTPKDGTSTTLYGIDYEFNELVAIGGTAPGLNVVRPLPFPQLSPNPLGFNFEEQIGFDISKANGTAYVSGIIEGSADFHLYTVNLQTGAATDAGKLFAEVRDIAVVAEADPVGDGGASSSGGEDGGGSSSGGVDGGSSGASSSSGASGASSSGTSGTSGASGTSGTSGASGSSGTEVGSPDDLTGGGCACATTEGERQVPWGAGALALVVGTVVARLRRRK